MEAASAQLALALTYEERVKAQYQGTRSRVDSAQVQLDKDELALRDSTLKAPFDDVILKRSIEVGTVVETKTVGFVVADTSSVKAVSGARGAGKKQTKALQRILEFLGMFR